MACLLIVAVVNGGAEYETLATGHCTLACQLCPLCNGPSLASYTLTCQLCLFWLTMPCPADCAISSQLWPPLLTVSSLTAPSPANCALSGQLPPPLHIAACLLLSVVYSLPVVKADWHSLREVLSMEVQK